MTLSVLICTYNRPRLLAQCLAALLERTTEKPDQVIVVDGGDECADRVVQDYARRPTPSEIKLVKTINKNLAASRNLGLPHCTGDIIALTDDDAEVFPDWVTQMKRAHAEHPEAGAVGGSVIGADSAALLSRIADRVTFPSYPTARNVRTVPGVNVSYKRAAVERVGAQDETLFRGEDVDYNWRVQQLGWTICFDPRVRVRHHHRPTWRALLNQHYMYGRAYYLVRRKWPEMYCVYPHHLRRPRDFLKAANFVAAIVYEPLLSAARLERWGDRVVSYPLMLANQVAWRAGMVRERLGAPEDGAAAARPSQIGGHRMMHERPQLSVIIPIHNEAAILSDTVAALVPQLEREVGAGNYELILCENGSTDATAEIAQRLAGQWAPVRVERLPRASYGKALRRGIAAARGNLLVIFNADFWDMGLVAHARVHQAEFDLLVGSKNVAGAVDRRPRYRRAITFGFNWFLRVAFGYRGTDTHGLKAMHAACAKTLAAQCLTDAEVFDTELVLRAQRAGLRLTEIAVTVAERRPSRYGLLTRVPRTFRDLIMLMRALQSRSKD